MRDENPRSRLNAEFHARLRRRLCESPSALEYLQARGLTRETIERFGLGLSLPYYSKRRGVEQSDALVYPLIGGDGRFYNKYGYYNIPGVTKNPPDVHAWGSGEAHSYYGGHAGSKKLVFVCREPLELWSQWQAIRKGEAGTGLLLVCSTRASEFPAAWNDPGFWNRWATVYLGHDNDEAGELLAAKLAELVGKDARRVRVPADYGKSWTAFWQGGAEPSEFKRLLQEAPVLSVKVEGESGGESGYGRFAYRPVNINGAYHNGHLYYPVQILSRTSDVVPGEGGTSVVRDVERLETVVVRSDRTLHSAVVAAAPRGTREKDRVMRLTDGTVIDREPQPNKYGTWSWPSIRDYLDGRSKARPLGEMLRDVLAYLKASVWLPYEEDYAILTLVVPVTYAQAVFDSVPLVFLNGPAGSGKSEMGRAMARVCSNAYVCGQSSAAAIARFIDESRGFVVLDDLEAIGGRDGQFGELVQALKLSYNKATAVKLWTDVKTMQARRLDFYGVKMINNTRGTNGILGSRMLRIQTRRLPEGMRGKFGNTMPEESVNLDRLRDELHCWTFENVGLIDTTYRALYARPPDRSEEITAPLRVMAHIAGDPGLSSRLEVALTRQSRGPVDLSAPKELLGEALRNLIARGYDTVSPTHVTLEVRRLISQGGGAASETMPEWLNPRWVGRMMHGMNVLDEQGTAHKRIRVHGTNLRFFRVSTAYLDDMKARSGEPNTEALTAAKGPVDFCAECESCVYNTVDCEIRRRRYGWRGKPAGLS
jgi:hypothetical protein